MDKMNILICKKDKCLFQNIGKNNADVCSGIERLVHLFDIPQDSKDSDIYVCLEHRIIHVCSVHNGDNLCDLDQNGMCTYTGIKPASVYVKWTHALQRAEHSEESFHKRYISQMANTAKQKHATNPVFIKYTFSNFSQSVEEALIDMNLDFTDSQTAVLPQVLKRCYAVFYNSLLHTGQTLTNDVNSFMLKADDMFSDTVTLFMDHWHKPNEQLQTLTFKTNRNRGATYRRHVSDILTEESILAHEILTTDCTGTNETPAMVIVKKKALAFTFKPKGYWRIRKSSNKCTDHV